MQISSDYIYSGNITMVIINMRIIMIMIRCITLWTNVKDATSLQ